MIPGRRVKSPNISNAYEIPQGLARGQKSSEKKMKLVLYTAIIPSSFTRRSSELGCEMGVNMAARKRANKRSSQPVYGLPVPEGLHEAIEIQRGNLAKAESVLGCLIASMEYEADSVDRPYYPDVAELARELVKQSIKGLDSLVLQQRLLRNKVREHLDLTYAEDAYRVSYH
jgi:hypothetical protein